MRSDSTAPGTSSEADISDTSSDAEDTRAESLGLSACIPVLETERLVLRAFTQNDFEDFATIVADPEVVQYLDNGEPISREDCWRGMAIFLGHWHLRGYGWWAVEDRGSGAFLGRIGLYKPEGWPGLEVGWLLRREAWGGGLATEGARAALDYAFEAVGADHVISVIDPRNVRSIRVAEKLGEHYEQQLFLEGKALAVYGMDRRAWRSTRVTRRG